MNNKVTPPTAHRDPGGFTLMEVLVVIVIIVLLMSLVTAGGMRLMTSAKESEARSMLAGLNGVAANYEAATTKPVSHLTDNLFDWDSPKAFNNGNSGQGRIDDYIERFIWAAYQIPDLNRQLRTVGKKRLLDADGDGFLELLDPWGHQMSYAFLVRHDRNPEDDFLPEHNRPFFASPGVDGEWGEPRTRSELGSDSKFESYQQTPEYKEASDNLYSTGLDRSTLSTE